MAPLQLHALLPFRILGFQVTAHDKFTLLIFLEHVLLALQYGLSRYYSLATCTSSSMRLLCLRYRRRTSCGPCRFDRRFGRQLDREPTARDQIKKMQRALEQLSV